MNACGSITFHKITCSDHKGFFLDKERYYILQDKRSTIDSLFSRSLISSNLQVIRKYKKQLERRIKQNNIKERLEVLRNIIDKRTLTISVEKELNNIDNIITTSMIQVENNSTGHFNDEPWSPELH